MERIIDFNKWYIMLIWTMICIVVSVFSTVNVYEKNQIPLKEYLNLYYEQHRIQNYTCDEVMAYHNQKVDWCMDIAKQEMKEGYYSKKVYEECYPLNWKTEVYGIMDEKCEEVYG